MNQPLDFDTPWKEILDVYLCEFFAFFFPLVHDEIDWQQPVVPYPFATVVLAHLTAQQTRRDLTQRAQVKF